MKMFGEPRLVRALTDEQIEATRDPRLVPGVKLPWIEDTVKAGGFLAGTPGDIIGQLNTLEKRYPTPSRVTVAQSLGFAAAAVPGAVGAVREGCDAGVQKLIRNRITCLDI